MTLTTFIQASAHQLTGISDSSVQMICTSPPYYGLRRYSGDQDIEWPAVDYAPMPGLPALHVAGCDPACVHEWTDVPPRKPNQVEQTKWKNASAAGDGQTQPMGAYCAKCGGWRGGLGNEPTLEAYIGHLVLCLREWRRVLRDDGCCFVNLGDSYAGSGGAGGDYNEGGLRAGQPKFKAGKSNGLKPKDLMLVPARFALAAQADGWWLRSDIIGAKVAPMPESVTDRPTRSHEHIFMLTKASRYYWDVEGAKEKALQPEGEAKLTAQYKADAGGFTTNGHGASTLGTNQGPSVRNMRDVIEWRPSPFPGAHFACWPEAIPEKLIRAATSERGACPHCGKAWRRVVEGARYEPPTVDVGERHVDMSRGDKTRKLNGKSDEWKEAAASRVTTGWQPSCACPPHDPTPCVVLDPFSGSGTTVKVAVRLGRRGIGVDIAAEYLGEVTAQRFGAGVQMELVA